MRNPVAPSACRLFRVRCSVKTVHAQIASHQASAVRAWRSRPCSSSTLRSDAATICSTQLNASAPARLYGSRSMPSDPAPSVPSYAGIHCNDAGKLVNVPGSESMPWRLPRAACRRRRCSPPSRPRVAYCRGTASACCSRRCGSRGPGTPGRSPRRSGPRRGTSKSVGTRGNLSRVRTVLSYAECNTR